MAAEKQASAGVEVDDRLTAALMAFARAVGVDGLQLNGPITEEWLKSIGFEEYETGYFECGAITLSRHADDWRISIGFEEHFEQTRSNVLKLVSVFRPIEKFQS